MNCSSQARKKTENNVVFCEKFFIVYTLCRRAGEIAHLLTGLVHKA